MSLQWEGIHRVRAVVLPDGTDTDGRSVAVSRTALVTWRSDLQGVLFQAYVNGRFAGATQHPDQRQLVIRTPASFDAAAHVEVVAVQPTEVHLDFSGQCSGRMDDARVTLILLRSQRLPIGASIDIYQGCGEGAIDYRSPVNAEPIPVWPCPQDKAGFGMARFGEGDFGFDSAAAIGFGKGRFGRGEFGLDADTIEWISPVRPEGIYRFGVVVTDESGRTSPPGETGPVTITPSARPAASLSVASFEPEANHLTLRIADRD
jgi:hypothetical protein